MATDAAYSADLERPLVPTAILPRPGAGAFLKENGLLRELACVAAKTQYGGPDGI